MIPAKASAFPGRPGCGRALIFVIVALLTCHGLTQMPSAFGESGLPTEEQLRAAANQALVKMDEYNDPDKSFKMNYPANWEVGKPESQFIFQAHTLAGTVDVRVMEESMPFTLEDFTKLISTEFGGKPNYVKVSQENVQLHKELPACKIVYNVTESSGLKEQQVLVLSAKNGRGYLVLFTTLQDWSARFASVFEKITDSIDLPQEDELSPAKLAAIKMTQYKNTEFSFKMDYPVNWEVGKPEPPNFLAVEYKPRAATVTALAVPFSGTSEEFTNSMIAAVAAPNRLKTSQVNVQIQGVPACKIGYSTDTHGVKVEQLVVLAVKNGHGYGVSFTTPAAWSSALAGVFEKMTESIDLSGK